MQTATSDHGQQSADHGHVVQVVVGSKRVGGSATFNLWRIVGVYAATGDAQQAAAEWLAEQRRRGDASRDLDCAIHSCQVAMATPAIDVGGATR